MPDGTNEPQTDLADQSPSPTGFTVLLHAGAQVPIKASYVKVVAWYPNGTSGTIFFLDHNAKTVLAQFHADDVVGYWRTGAAAVVAPRQ